ncbi:MAG: GntR family transcriptional regulator [Actinophytocola sp.]|uniref:GntR family transcriptional regulator n=1 Tax=Actinophytocola sp. TaxID=1872138 RepID=UPI003D6BBB4A
MQHEPTTGTVPVHLQIADALRARITSGELAPGDAIPSASSLADEWGCSVGSARSAIAVLMEEGRLSGGRGKSATVRQPPVRRSLTLSSDWSQVQKDMVLRPIGERRKRGAVELIAGIPIDDTDSSASYNRVLATPEIAQEFELPVGTEMLQRTYEMTDKDSGARIAWSVSYIPVEYIKENPDLLDETKEPWPGGHQHQLFTVGIEIDRFMRKVTAIQPTPGDRQKWRMEPGVPLLHVRSKSIDISEKVVEMSDATYPVDRTEIVYVEQLKRWTPQELEAAHDH